jgi:hypothetical protein
MKQERKILFYKDYFISFYRSLDSGAQKKLDYVLGKQDENLRLKYKGVITVNNDNSRRVVLSFYKDMTYDISTTISPVFGNEGDKYMSGASGVYREEDDRIILEESAQIGIWEKVGKYEWKTENENTMELSKWFPVEYTMSGDNIESLSNGVGILVKGIKY